MESFDDEGEISNLSKIGVEDLGDTINFVLLPQKK